MLKMMKKDLLFNFVLPFVVMALLFSSCEQNPNLLLLTDKCHEDNTTYCHYFIVYEP